MKLKPFAALLAVALLCLPPANLTLPAQTSDTPSGPVLLSDADLQQLVAPIALYPDPMLALILQASTVPTDIVLASRFLNNGGDEDDIDSQPWDDSVKGLAHYPDTLQMMDENLDWTNQLGAAVLAQQADVMRAVQAMRAKAQAQGNLQTTAQQQVIVQNNVIEIVPANPQVIYVPTYNPTVIYYQPAPPIIFGSGFAVGIWIGGGCNWNSGYFYRSGYYRPGYGWGYGPNRGVVWRPPPGRPPPRPPYKPGKPGNLPGWRPPPGGKPPGGGRPPGGPNRPPPGSKPRPPVNGPGTPGKPGNRPIKPENPTIQPVPNPGNGNGGNKPNKPGNRPGGGNPAIQPAPNPGSGNGNKPGARPNRPQQPEKPVTIQPVNPQPKPSPKPSPKPAPQPKPSPKPPPSNAFDRNKPSSKPQVQPKPAPQQRPSGGAKSGGGNRGGGSSGGNAQGNRRQGQ